MVTRIENIALQQLPDSEIHYIPDFLSAKLANKYFEDLFHYIPWRQDPITLFGKTHPQPRLTSLHAHTLDSYSYSGIVMTPHPMTETLQLIEKKIYQFCDASFTTVLLNLYRDGKDSNGWHADNERELGKNPVIASITLGEERPFHFKHRTIKTEKHKLKLQHGSLLLMSGEMQHYWLHHIPKTKTKINPRINLTFRIIK